TGLAGWRHGGRRGGLRDPGARGLDGLVDLRARLSRGAGPHARVRRARHPDQSGDGPELPRSGPARPAPVRKSRTLAPGGGGSAGPDVARHWRRWVSNGPLKWGSLVLVLVTGAAVGAPVLAVF